MMMNQEDKIFYEQNGRAFKKELFEKQIPHYTYVYGKFTGKFHSDKLKTDHQREEFYDFKIYEAEVEIVKSDKDLDQFNARNQNAVKIEQAKLPEKIYFYERKGNQKVYFDLNLNDPVFHNFKFISLLQQNNDNESFGTVEGDILGYLVEYETQKWYKKRYKKINLLACKTCIRTAESTGKVERKDDCYREEFWCEGKKETYWGEWICPPVPPPPPPGPPTKPFPPRKPFSPCFRNLLLSIALTFLGLILGFTPITVIGLLWMLFVLYKCYFSWLRYLGYFFGLLFFMSLVYSIINTNWKQSAVSYIPKPATVDKTKTILVKGIQLISKDGKTEDLLISRNMSWNGYSGEKYHGNYSVKKSDLDQSRNFKNSLSQQSAYNSVIYNLSAYDSNKLSGLYSMFDKIQSERRLNNKMFAEMVVSFVQQIPYYLVLDQSCNINDYQDPSVKQILKENPGRCTPNQKFGITTPVEFMANLQGDCDSRTVLLYTILKHYNYEVAIFSSEIYKHSILGVELPYNGVKYPIAGHQYTLWETTDIFSPGTIPQPITNLNYWSLSLN